MKIVVGISGRPMVTYLEVSISLKIKSESTPISAPSTTPVLIDV